MRADIDQHQQLCRREVDFKIDELHRMFTSLELKTGELHNDRVLIHAELERNAKVLRKLEKLLPDDPNELSALEVLNGLNAIARVGRMSKVAILFWGSIAGAISAMVIFWDRIFRH